MTRTQLLPFACALAVAGCGGGGTSGGGNQPKPTTRATNPPAGDGDLPGRIRAEHQLGALHRHLKEFALKNRARFPKSVEELKDLKLAERPTAAEVPWGESANRIVWAHAPNTRTAGGYWMRYDGKVFKATAEEFARIADVPLTAKTFPADLLAGASGERHKPADIETGGDLYGMAAEKAFDADWLAPRNLDEFPKFTAWHKGQYSVLAGLESGEVVVRWGNGPARGWYAHNKGFEKTGGWVIVNTVVSPATPADAARLIGEYK